MPPCSIEVLIPLRNAPAVFRTTVDSLLAQTDRGFRVLLSDNHSTTGGEVIAETLDRLHAAGIAAERLAPPVELERVEHWNWLHFQATAPWLKPLFAGDWLEPDYIASVRAEIAAEPRCRYVYCGYLLHDAATGAVTETRPGWAGPFRPAEEMREIVLRYAHQSGPPSAAIYERTAFVAAGGYRTGLPIAADSLLFCALAARHGAKGIPRALCHFNLHGGRFTNLLPGRQLAVYREKFTYIATLAYHAWTEKLPVPKLALARLTARELRKWWIERTPHTP